MTSPASLTIDTPAGPRPALLAVPEGDGPHPGVVVIHDIFGLQPDTGRHCQKFAEAGFAAIAPDLYDGGRAGCVVRTLTAMITERGEPLDVVAAAKQALVAQAGVAAHRIAVTGFCMGGGFALLAAADDTYAVAAPFYGSVPRRSDRLQGLCPTLAQFGRRDWMFAPHARRLSAHLEALDIPHEVLIHDGVGHSFMNDHDLLVFRASGGLPPMNAGHHPETEAVAWGHVLRFLETHLPM